MGIDDIWLYGSIFVSIAVRKSFWGFSQGGAPPTSWKLMGNISYWLKLDLYHRYIMVYHGISIYLYIYIYNHKKFRHQLRQLWITTSQALYAALPSTDLARRFWASHLTFSNSASAMILWMIHTLFTHMFNPCMGNIPINIIYMYILYYISYIMYIQLNYM